MCEMCKETLRQVGELRENLGKAMSYSHDAKATSEATHKLCAHVLTTTEALHKRFDEVNDQQWEKIGEMDNKWSRVSGAWVGITLVFTAIGVGLTAIWEAVKHWGAN